ncbi:FAD-dependent monooxygenase [Mesorhizobium xinjiangense]|uniref:FAD-dependent monooxygenase n=1 Tax=Mesorhizobium xinjiangense TaxID=2678685 RepID=UPI0012ECC62E|nr:FAD-dependent monooxygenase [Mesorhizobium xinjiangense]
MVKTGTERTIVIAGAGIAGLAAALCFARRGFHVRVFEQANELQAVGAGIQLSPNATRILAGLGVLERFASNAVQPQAIVLRESRRLGEIGRVRLGDFAERRWGAPYLAIHRADLHAALAQAAHATPGIELNLGAEALEVETLRDHVRLILKTGGREQTVNARLVVGADGVWSQLRSGVAGAARSHFTGLIAWRATVPVDPDQADGTVPLHDDCVSAILDSEFHIVAYPLRGGSLFNLVAVTRGRELGQGWSEAASVEGLQKALARADRRLLQLVSQAAPWTRWPLHCVDPAGRWTEGGAVALIGDAAHAMTPFAAQGAAMAIEDAAMLAHLVNRSDDIPTALALYEKLRRPRVTRVARRGALNRFVWHAGGPVAACRNAALSFMSPERLAAGFDWLYGFDVEDGE